MLSRAFEISVSAAPQRADNAERTRARPSSPRAGLSFCGKSSFRLRINSNASPLSLRSLLPPIPGRLPLDKDQSRSRKLSAWWIGTPTAPLACNGPLVRFDQVGTSFLLGGAITFRHSTSALVSHLLNLGLHPASVDRFSWHPSQLPAYLVAKSRNE